MEQYSSAHLHLLCHTPLASCQTLDVGTISSSHHNLLIFNSSYNGAMASECSGKDSGLGVGCLGSFDNSCTTQALTSITFRVVLISETTTTRSFILESGNTCPQVVDCWGERGGAVKPMRASSSLSKRIPHSDCMTCSTIQCNVICARDTSTSS